MIVCGDLNAGPQASPGNYRALLARGWSDPLATSADVTWDPANALSRGGPFSGSPSQRVDHVLLGRAAAERFVVRSARVVHREPVVPVAGGTVTLSDHAGVLVELEAPRG